MGPNPQIVGIVQQLVDDQQARHQAEEDRRAVGNQKLPSQQWNSQAMIVLRAIMGVMQEADLPPLWHIIASAPKHLICSEAQAAFDAMAQWLGFVTYSPIINVALLWALNTQSFCAESSTTLTEGIQPFNLVPPSFSSQATESTAAAADYDHITMGGQKINYSNVQAIQGCQNLVLPTSMSRVGVHICTSYITLATMQGVYHPFTTNMHALLNE